MKFGYALQGSQMTNTIRATCKFSYVLLKAGKSGGGK